MSNVTVLRDESIGGLQREYTEVKRRAAVGERIMIVGGGHIAEKTVITLNDRRLEIFDCGHINYVDGTHGVAAGNYVVLAPSDIIRIPNEKDGGFSRYRLVERKASVGERVVIVAATGNVDYRNGDVLEAAMRDDDIRGFKIYDRVGYPYFMFDSEYRVLEPLTSASTAQPSVADEDTALIELTRKVNRQADVIDRLSTQMDRAIADIANLALKATELARQNEQLRSDDGWAHKRINTLGAEVAELKRGRSGLATRMAEAAAAIGRTEPFRKKPSRDDIVERAKADVAELLRTPRDVYGNHPHFWPQIDGERTNWSPLQRVEFVINRGNRTIVALIKYLDDAEVFASGAARCAPDDVFNTHIGRAIALRRALVLPVPNEYYNAPKPDGVRVGDIVNGAVDDDHSPYSVSRRFKLTADCGNGSFKYAESRTDWIERRQIGRVIDDSREETKSEGVSAE